LGWAWASPSYSWDICDHQTGMTDQSNDKAPFFKNWTYWYWLVILFLVLLIVLFLLFTKRFA
jgi:disulfide bond formation protein DsbB